MGKKIQRVDFDAKGNPRIINVSKQDPDESGRIKDRGVIPRAIGKAVKGVSRYLDPH